MSLSNTHYSLLFGKKLTQAIRFIKAVNGRRIKDIETDLAAAVHRDASTIKHWRKGNFPPDTKSLEDLIRALHSLGASELGRSWFLSLLETAGYNYPEIFCNELFPPLQPVPKNSESPLSANTPASEETEAGQVESGAETLFESVRQQEVSRPAVSRETMDGEAEVVNGIESRLPGFAKWYARAVLIVGMVITVIGLTVDLPDFYERVRSWVVPTAITMDADSALNIAVVGFVEEGGHSAVGTELAESFFSLLDKNLESFQTSGATLDVWGPQQIQAAGQTIHGTSRSERGQAAATLATELKADIVVYGVITATETTWVLSPEFHVELIRHTVLSEEDGGERLAERVSEAIDSSLEIVGIHQLGKPIEIGRIVREIETNEKLSPRVDLLSQIVLGLLFYADQNYTKAIDFFSGGLSLYPPDIRDVACTPDTVRPTFGDHSITDDEGKELLYLLLGNSMGRLGNLECAEGFYKQAHHISDGYARAHIGLGSVYYARGLENYPDDDQLSLAVEHYQLALAAEYSSSFTDISTKAHFGLGHTYFLLGFAEDNYEAAEAEFQQVIDDFGNGANPRIRIMAGESHARLGLILRESAECDPILRATAAQEYETAAEILRFANPDRSKIFRENAQELRTGNPCGTQSTS